MFQHPRGPTKINHDGVCKDLRQDRSRSRRYRNRMDQGRGLESAIDLSSDEDDSSAASSADMAAVKPSSSKNKVSSKKNKNASAPAATASASTPAAAPAPAPVTITDRTRLKCMSKLYSKDTTPSSKKHCKRLYQGIIAKDPVVTTAINDLGFMGVSSQEVVERTKLFVDSTPPSSK